MSCEQGAFSTPFCENYFCNDLTAHFCLNCGKHRSKHGPLFQLQTESCDAVKGPPPPRPPNLPSKVRSLGNDRSPTTEPDLLPSDNIIDDFNDDDIQEGSLVSRRRPILPEPLNHNGSKICQNVKQKKEKHIKNVFAVRKTKRKAPQPPPDTMCVLPDSLAASNDHPSINLADPKRHLAASGDYPCDEIPFADCHQPINILHLCDIEFATNDKSSLSLSHNLEGGEEAFTKEEDGVASHMEELRSGRPHRVMFSPGDDVVINDIVGCLYYSDSDEHSMDMESETCEHICISETESITCQHIHGDENCVDTPTDNTRCNPGYVAIQNANEPISSRLNKGGSQLGDEYQVLPLSEDEKKPFKLKGKRRGRAPSPPSKAVALKLDSKTYMYTINIKSEKDVKIGKNHQFPKAAVRPPPPLERSDSVESLPNPDMPTKGKGFFKTLLRKGKKSEKQEPEFEAPDTVVDNHSDDDYAFTEGGQLPNEFLDTWVKSTTQQQIDETDPALQGVWPYDKKEDDSEKIVTEGTWNSKDIDTSNFILKEKTKKSKTGGDSVRNKKSLAPTQTMTLQRSERSSASSKQSGSGLLSDIEDALQGFKLSGDAALKLQSIERGTKSVSQQEANAVGATLVKKRNKTDSDLFNNNNWEIKSNQSSGILKNGSKGSSGTVNSLQKVTQVAVHGRQPSVPSSTYSGSSSGHSTDYRIKEEPEVVTQKPTLHYNPHDSGYESGTIKSKKDSLSNEISTLKRAKRSPTQSLSSRSAQRSNMTAIDSITLCFDQLATMNASTLHQLCVNYSRSQKLPTPPSTSTSASSSGPVTWYDIVIENELSPIYVSKQCAMYKAHWRSKPEERITVMLSIKSPTKVSSFKPNLMTSQVYLEADVAPHLIPDVMLSNKSIKPSKSDQDGAVDDTTLRRSYVQESKAKLFQRQQSVPNMNSNNKLSVMSKTSSTVSDDAADMRRAKYKVQKSGDSNLTDENRDSVFITECSADSIESLESLEEEAVDSILAAVAGEESEADHENNNHKRVIPLEPEINLNCNNNNNVSDPTTPNTPSSDFVLADHLLEMAGGERNDHDRDSSMSESSSVQRAAAGLNCCDSKVIASRKVSCHVTVLPDCDQVESLKDYIVRIKTEGRSKEDLEMEMIYVLLQVINIIQLLNESHLKLDTISASDFVVTSDPEDMSTLHCTMLNVSSNPNQQLGLSCEKLRMFMMQLEYSIESLSKSTTFAIVDDMIQNASDLGDLKTISTILKYLLWGPKEEEVRILTMSEHRRQAFELWLQLARGRLLSRLTFRQMDKLKIYMIGQFLSGTNGNELFKITKLLNTY